MNCPHCNGGLRIVATRTTRTSARQTLEASWTNASDAATLTHVPERTPDYSRTPVRAPTLQSDVAVPLLQSVTSGVVVFIGTGGLAVALEAHKPLAWAGVCGFAALSIGWRGALQWTRAAVHRVEQWTNTDIDGDGQVGAPQPDATQWWNVNGDARILSNDDKKYAAFLCFVRIVNNAQSTGQRTGQKALRGKALGYHYKVTDDLHREFFQLLIEHKLAEQTGSGPRLTATRREVEAAIGPPPQ